MVVRETELSGVLGRIEKPALVITDSQAFARVSKDTPEDIPLTSFSILMARYKGFLDAAVKGVKAIDDLKDGDKVLISEGCTGKELDITLSSGHGFPEELSDFALCIHCGGCMLGSKELTYRMKCADDAGVPFTNYGIAIAYMKGILKRSIGVFPHLVKELEDHNGGQRTY